MKDEYSFKNGKRGAVVPPPPGTVTLIRISLDEEVVDWFHTQADKTQSDPRRLINQVLREYVEREKASKQQDSLTETASKMTFGIGAVGGNAVQETQDEAIRRVVREELALAGLTVGS